MISYHPTSLSHINSTASRILQTIQKNWDKLQVGYFSQKNFRGPQTTHFVDADLSKFSLRNWKTNLPKFLVILGWISFRESEFLGKISLELIFENWSKIVFRGSPTEIFSESNFFDLKRSEKQYFFARGLLVGGFWPIFAQSSRFHGISGDLFFNSLAKIYLSQYRRNEGSAALENFFEKSTQLEIYLIFFGLSVAFLFVKWQLREAFEIIC